MAKVKIKTGVIDKYNLFEDGYWKLEGNFSKWKNKEVQQIEFTLKDKVENHVIQDVNYCKTNNRLEIHVFKGGNGTSSFTATKTNLKGMTLDNLEERDLDFIDYIKDTNPYVKLCFGGSSGGGGAASHPEVKKGNILQGGN